MPQDLNHSPQGFRGVITGIDADAKLQRRLMSLGLRKGQSLRVVQQRRSGVVVSSQGNRIALGPDIAAAIRVAPTPSTSPMSDAAA